MLPHTHTQNAFLFHFGVGWGGFSPTQKKGLDSFIPHFCFHRIAGSVSKHVLSFLSLFLVVLVVVLPCSECNEKERREGKSEYRKPATARQQQRPRPSKVKARHFTSVAYTTTLHHPHTTHRWPYDKSRPPGARPSPLY